LDPGVDPIVEADRRGAILAIVRLGNKDLEIPAEMIEEGGVMPASYMQGAGMPFMSGPGTPQGMAVGGAGTLPSHYISGVTGPQYGMPTCGTPIGLPGPPHVPLGIPAGLRKHVIKNHTKVRIPKPTRHVRIDVKQTPGMSYPRPANRVSIHEKTHAYGPPNCQPLCDKHQVFVPGCGTCQAAAACESGGCEQ